MERMRRVRARDQPARLGVALPPGARRGRLPRRCGVHGAGRAEVDGRTLRFARAVIATGARPARPPIPGLDEAGYLTNETVFELTERPRRLAVIGGGPIGCELAQAFRRLGARGHAPARRRAAPAARGRGRGRDRPAGASPATACASILGAKVAACEREATRKVVRYRDGRPGRALAVDEILVGDGPRAERRGARPRGGRRAPTTAEGVVGGRLPSDHQSAHLRRRRRVPRAGSSPTRPTPRRGSWSRTRSSVWRAAPGEPAGHAVVHVHRPRGRARRAQRARGARARDRRSTRSCAASRTSTAPSPTARPRGS